MMRPQVSVFLGLSLDGYIARPDGSIDWLDRWQSDPPEDSGYDAFMQSVDTLVVGRGTYDTVMGFDSWPYTGKSVVVLTTRPAVPNHGETFYNGPLAALIDQLGERGAKRIYLDGGVAVQQGLKAGIVTDLTLTWLPIILGAGRSMFDPALPEIPLRLKASRTFPSGLLQAVYTVAAATDPAGT
jgi:dihydrofolate reductase